MGCGASSASVHDQPLRDWSEDEVQTLLNHFSECDKDGNGTLEYSEILTLLSKTGEQLTHLDKGKGEGRVNAKEFFRWYTHSTDEEATAVFKKHAELFGEYRVWDIDAVDATLGAFDGYDTDKSGFIEWSEVAKLVEVIGIKIADIDSLNRDNKLDRKEFFMWQLNCTKAATEKAFAEYDARRKKPEVLAAAVADDHTEAADAAPPDCNAIIAAENEAATLSSVRSGVSHKLKKKVEARSAVQVAETSADYNKEAAAKLEELLKASAVRVPLAILLRSSSSRSAGSVAA